MSANDDLDIETLSTRSVYEIGGCVHAKTLSHPAVNSMVYSPGPAATFATLYVGEGSVSNVLGPEVRISDSELVSALYFECSDAFIALIADFFYAVV